ncbi:hypothetical protein KIN20_030273 [Parelaphostrongylus tenuis]|uniref:Uncharacterized protein n=1 Tax=Parelaphostrongylus tenuis TaxID=148309 RepID=A0AAD5WG14_PARTN|nr:hypothetical protein KIN20_030273 [Parelaphostrongylus tenuis]
MFVKRKSHTRPNMLRVFSQGKGFPWQSRLQSNYNSLNKVLPGGTLSVNRQFPRRELSHQCRISRDLFIRVDGFERV